MVKAVSGIMTNRLNIYLLKDIFSKADSMISDPANLKTANLRGIGTLYYEPSHQIPPEWISTFFKNHPAIIAADFVQSGTQAVLIASVVHKGKRRFFAICFGTGRFLLKDNSCEERFGLITALNMIEAKALRGIDRHTLTSNPKLSREQIARASIVSDFGLDFEKDLVHSITGKSKTLYSDFGNIITGKESLSISAKIDISNIGQLLRKAITTYDKTDYKTDFDWIDQIKEVKDAPTLDGLNSDLAVQINGVVDTIWLAVPEIIDWTDLKGFKYSTKRKSEFYDDLGVKDLANEFNKDIKVEDLFKKHIRFYSNSDDQPKYKWTIFSCLNAEMDLKGNKYLLSGGKWYLINPDYVGTVNKEIDAIKKSKIVFVDYNHSDEADYNNDVASKLLALSMDRKLVTYGGGNSSIEFCDILTKNGDMIHAKKYGGSAVLSHLFNQGFVSAELFVTDPAFRKELKDKVIGTAYKKLIPANRPDTKQYSVVYAIIQKKPSDGIFKLPFFSKVSLRRCKRVLEGYGYNVFLDWVDNKK